MIRGAEPQRVFSAGPPQRQASVFQPTGQIVVTQACAVSIILATAETTTR